MAANSLINLVDAMTTRKGAVAGGVALLTLGAFATVGSSPAVSTDSQLQLAQAGASTQAAVSTIDAGPFSAEQRQAIERIVKDYLLKNPEILLEVGKELEQRQAAAQVAQQQRLIMENKSQIFAAPTDFVLGNPNGDIAVVEFFDYNCGWCKRAVDEISKLAAADSNVKIIFKEFPIFGEDSVIAAKAAMASIKQGKYWDFHRALMKEQRRVTEDVVFQVAEKVGLDVAKLKSDMNNPEYDAAIKSTSDIAQGLGFEGTPGFIVDSKVHYGFLPADGLQQLIGEARKVGCQVC